MAKKKAVKRSRLNADRVKSLYKSLKSISAVAKKIGASYVGVRRNLLTQGVKLVKA